MNTNNTAALKSQLITLIGDEKKIEAIANAFATTDEVAPVDEVTPVGDVASTLPNVDNNAPVQETNYNIDGVLATDPTKDTYKGLVEVNAAREKLNMGLLEKLQGGGRRRSTRRRHKKSSKKSRRQSKKGGKKHKKSTKKGKKRSQRKH